MIVLLAAAPRANAQWVCPLEPGAPPARCAKLEHRAEKLRLRAERDAAVRAYRSAHPWRVSLLLETSLFGLGLGHVNVAGSWGVGAGVSTLRELGGSWALRMDGLGRFGRGHISSWGFANPGPIDASTDFLGGVELRAAMLARFHNVYIGPALALGLLGLQRQTLHEADFPGEGGDYDHGFSATVRVPSAAAFMAAGLMVGGEPAPRGPVSFNLHMTPGVWNDFRHFYFSIALDVSVKLWD